MEYECLTCKNKFEAPSNKNRPRKYCSKVCKGFSQNKKGKIFKCPICSKEIYLAPSKIVEGKKLYFCSSIHYGKYIEKWGLNHTCLCCGKEFKSSYNGKRKYCSTTCSNSVTLKKVLANKENNEFENSCYEMLNEMGLNYLRQEVINNKFVVDALLPNSIVIEFDGDYWHGNIDKFPILNSSQIKSVGRDKSRQKYLEVCGYKVIRFWESDFKRDRDKVIRYIKERINE